MGERWKPEANAKPLGMIMLRKHEKAEFDALTEAQRGYFLHWTRSNVSLEQWPPARNWWKLGMRKAREQRP